MHRFEPITGIRQRACHDGAHGIIKVRLLHLVVDVYFLYQAKFHNISIQPSPIPTPTLPFPLPRGEGREGARKREGLGEDELMFYTRAYLKGEGGKRQVYSTL